MFTSLSTRNEYHLLTLLVVAIAAADTASNSLLFFILITLQFSFHTIHSLIKDHDRRPKYAELLVSHILPYAYINIVKHLYDTIASRLQRCISFFLCLRLITIYT